LKVFQVILLAIAQSLLYPMSHPNLLFRVPESLFPDKRTKRIDLSAMVAAERRSAPHLLNVAASKGLPDVSVFDA